MAYAAILSLSHTIQRLLNNLETKYLLSYSETKLIHDDLFDWGFFLETMEPLNSINIASESRVRDALRKLEHLIDSHISDRLVLLSDQSASMDDHNTSFTLLLSQQLPKVKEEIISFLAATLSNMNDKDQQQQRYSSSSSSSSSSYSEQQNLLVGLDDQIRTLKRWIWSPQADLVVGSVVGMSGIGKTALVKHVYNDPRVAEEFEIRLFVQIGPQYNRLEEILLCVLNQLGVIPSDDDAVDENIDYVHNQLSEALSGKKYLIVLDNVWTDTQVWVKLQFSAFPYDEKVSGFPDNGKGSRVIIISQIRNGDAARVIVLPLLKEEESWKLLHQTTFGNSDEKCSRELEKIGKKIAKNCEGLPAAIIQVGENLRGKSFQEWKALSEKEDPLVITRDDHTPLSKSLYLNYMMLPQYLKLCFLYMGVFPKNYVISRSKLFKLWISEGFLVPYMFLNEEETAGTYLDQLIRQSVVLSEKDTSLTFSPKSCRLHFTFRSLCVNEAKSETFFHILKKYTDCTPENLRSQQRLCVHNNVVLAFTQVHEWMKSVSDARSLLCFGPKQQYPIELPLCFKLLKVLDALAIRFYEFPHHVLASVHLRYLAITCDEVLPNSISRLSNLEVLIFCQHHNIKLSNNNPVYLPIEIWNMHKLKQLYCKGFDLPTPPLSDSYLENLLTVSGVSVHSFTIEVLSRIPNLERVAVQIESAHDSIETFSFFGHFASLYHHFKSFKCIVVNPNLKSQIVPCVPNFPVAITKISLSGCGLPWKNLGVIATLPYLAVLKLRWYAFCGLVWNTSDGQFPSLQFLLLEDLDIKHWESGDEEFPHMYHVIIRHCYKLETIPKLKLNYVNVEVDYCSLSFEKKMRERQSIFGTRAKIRSSCTEI